MGEISQKVQDLASFDRSMHYLLDFVEMYFRMGLAYKNINQSLALDTVTT